MPKYICAILLVPSCLEKLFQVYSGPSEITNYRKIDLEDTAPSFKVYYTIKYLFIF